RYLLIQDSNKLFLNPKNHNNQNLDLSDKNNQKIWLAAEEYKTELGDSWEIEGMVVFPRYGINTYLLRIVNKKSYLMSIFEKYALNYIKRIEEPRVKINLS